MNASAATDAEAKVTTATLTPRGPRGHQALDLVDRSTSAALNARCDRARERLARAVSGAGWEVRGSGSPFRLFPVGDRDPGVWQRALWWATYRRGVLLMQTALAAVPTVLGEPDLIAATDVIAEAATEVAERLGEQPQGEDVG